MAERHQIGKNNLERREISWEEEISGLFGENLPQDTDKIEEDQTDIKPVGLQPDVFFSLNGQIIGKGPKPEPHKILKSSSFDLERFIRSLMPTEEQADTDLMDLIIEDQNRAVLNTKTVSSFLEKDVDIQDDYSEEAYP
ncbi:hypothetical protein A3A48_04250 [Candidatus Curtissbacteria bacterium RIFCSPLOWO2_01_FULL_37_9]|uniref:Uncharacterized protein n=1 Tax=Candidatus Curtissbacteria bacterium RIFCSPLOWO2_01_FULL_37_9 TaxID=1797724 RepID=A0A1F5GTE9_9BACT|nr:MAG: hypothetical protein A3A48_04250 [Candidatus Curtissbacteria bacterium RIFCSPLOWO2_01_FULL_37_9]